MTKERIYELDQIATHAIEESKILGNHADNASFAFWCGVKTVVEELKMDILEQERKLSRG